VFERRLRPVDFKAVQLCGLRLSAFPPKLVANPIQDRLPQ
jgi:hypothetical protein